MLTYPPPINSNLRLGYGMILPKKSHTLWTGTWNVIQLARNSCINVQVPFTRACPERGWEMVNSRGDWYWQAHTPDISQTCTLVDAYLVALRQVIQHGNGTPKGVPWFSQPYFQTPQRQIPWTTTHRAWPLCTVGHNLAKHLLSSPLPIYLDQVSSFTNLKTSANNVDRSPYPNHHYPLANCYITMEHHHF